MIEVKKIGEIDKRLREIYDRGMKAWEIKNYGYALEMFRTVLRSEPGVFEIRDKLRDVAFEKMGSKVSAMHQGLAMIMTIPNQIKGPILCGKKDFGKALDNAEAALAVDPSYIGSIFLMTAAAEAADFSELSVRTLEYGLRYHAKSVSLLQRLADISKNRGDHRKTLFCYQQLTTLVPQNPHYVDELKNVTALATMQDGGWTDAEKGKGDYRNMMKDKDEMIKLEQEGRTYRGEEALANLIREQLKTIEEQDTVNNNRTLADYYGQAEDYEKAIATWERVVELAGVRDPAVDKAITDLVVKQFDKVISEWEVYAETEGIKDEDRQNAVNQIAELRTQKEEDLISRHEEIIKRNPQAVEERFELAKKLYDRGDIDDALAHFQNCRRNARYELEATIHVGRCFTSKEMYDLASDAFKAVIKDIVEMNTVKKDAIYDLGAVYEAMGENEQAMDQFKKIYAVDMKFRDVADRVEGKGGSSA